MEKSIAVIEPQKVPQEALSLPELKNQVMFIHQVMRDIMSEGEHYGKIPGCGPKPTLLKAGAEKLCLTFRLAPTFTELAGTVEKDDFICYKIKCELTHINTGKVMGSGVGACNSKERKYKNASPYDIQNTLYKMACKRALVAAVLVSTAASDLFTQDLEDMEIKPTSVVMKNKPIQQDIIQEAIETFEPEKVLQSSINSEEPKKKPWNPPTVKVEDGKICVINSYMVKDKLKSAGYLWDGNLKGWVKPYSDEAFEEVQKILEQ